MGFLTNEKKQNKTTRNEKTRKERKERVRGTYLSATLGGRCWVFSYAANRRDLLSAVRGALGLLVLEEQLTWTVLRLSLLSTLLLRF